MTEEALNCSPELPVRPMLWRVLVKKVDPITKTAGGIELPDEVKENQNYINKVGEVLAIGSQAFKGTTKAGIHLGDEPLRPEVGDYVLFGSYAGASFKAKGSDALFVLLADTDIVGITDRPDLLTTYL